MPDIREDQDVPNEQPDPELYPTRKEQFDKTGEVRHGSHEVEPRKVREEQEGGEQRRVGYGGDSQTP